MLEADEIVANLDLLDRRGQMLSMPRLQDASSFGTSERSRLDQFTQFTQFTRERWQCASPTLFLIRLSISHSSSLHSSTPFSHIHNILQSRYLVIQRPIRTTSPREQTYRFPFSTRPWPPGDCRYCMKKGSAAHHGNRQCAGWYILCHLQRCKSLPPPHIFYCTELNF